MYTRCEKERKILGAHPFICKLLLRCESSYIFCYPLSRVYTQRKDVNDIVMGFDKRCLDLFLILKKEEIILAEVT